MSKYIHFIGKRTDLKPMGFKFQKLFARNYRCWHWHVDPEGYGDSLWVWDKGKTVEVNDLYDMSYLILEEIVMKGRKGHRIKPDGKIFFGEATSGRFILDKETNELLDYSFDKTLVHLQIMADRAGTPLTQEYRNAYYKRYSEFGIDDELVAKLKEMLDKGMIEIAERP